MKVAWIVPGFSSDKDDWCIPALLDLARALSQRYDLHIVALQYPYRRDTYCIGQATVHSIGGSNRGGVFTPLIWREAARVVGRLDFDVLHAFWIYEPGVLAAFFRHRAPIVISLAGGELIDLPQIGYGLAGRLHVRMLMRWALRRANTITAGSHSLLEIGRRFVGQGNFVFAPFGVDLKRWPQPGIRSQSPVLLNVASLEPVKGQATLLRAFRQVADECPAARLALAGKGRLDAALRRLASELRVSGGVDFRGEVLHHRLPDLYRAATLFVQSSLHEAQGMALLEAAACGLPIVGTSVGALADLAPDAAVASPPGDPVRLAQAILSVLDDPARQRMLSESARARVEAVYSLEAAVSRFETLYRG